jgi:CRISPR/Cas system-associated exonuclease Cas4 (RecB family)
MKTFTHKTGLPQLQSLPTKEIDGKRHYLLPNGQYVPSVTTVLGHFKKKQIQEWRNRVGHEEANKISNRASTRGTKFHTLMEKYLSNESVTSIITENTMPTIKESFHMMKKEVDEHIDNIHYIEVPLYSTSMRMAGRTDIIAEYDGKLSVIDFKTSSREKKEKHIQDYFLQSSAYALMYEELFGREIEKIVIMMASDGLPEPQIFIKNTIDYHEPLLKKIVQYFRENGLPNDISTNN